MHKFFFLRKEQVAQWWPKLQPLAAAAMKTMRGKYDDEDIFTCAVLGKVQFWVVAADEDLDVKMLGITQLNDFPGTRICQVICVTGKERKSWENLMHHVETWAKHNGCTDMELVARPGWERIMNKYGYEKTHVVLNKTLLEK